MKNETAQLAGLERCSVLALDAATHYTGAAVWVGDGQRGHRLTYAGNVRGNGEWWEWRCHNIVKIIFESLEPDCVVIEYPYFQANERGITAARSGDTLKLAFLCGMLTETAMRLKAVVKLVTYNQWNGQLPKDVTAKRCKEHYGLEFDSNTIENNVSDAIMLGDWYIKQILGEKVIARTPAHCPTSRTTHQ